MPAAAPEKRLEWAPRALEAYLATLARIAEEDPLTARQFMERVERSLAVILVSTGRVTRNVVRIRLWYRARQHVFRR